MIGLDTPLLLAVLRGGETGRKLLRELGDEELVTTELNLLELDVLARRDPSAGRERRLAGIQRLRQRLTVVPVDMVATQTAALHAAHGPPSSILLSAMLGSAEAAGCTRWITTDDSGVGRWPGRMKVARFA